MYIPFVNGEPIYPIPNGFREEAEDAIKKEDEDINKAVQSTSVRQQQSDDGDSGGFDASSTQDYKVAMQLSESEAKARGATGLLGNLMQGAKDLFSKLPGAVIVDNALNKLNPDREFSQGPVSDIYGDDYITDANQKEIYAKQSGYASLDAMTKQYGIEPTFKFGTKPGDVSLVTGKPYNSVGQSEQSDGSVAFASWDDWTNSLAASAKTGWMGGTMTEAQIQRYTNPTLASGLPNPNYNKDWNRNKIDAYMKEINKTYGKEDDDKDDSKVITTTKNKAVLQTPTSNIMTGGLDDGAKPSVKTPQVPIGTEAVDRSIRTKFQGAQQKSPTTSMDSGDGTAVPTKVGATGDLNQIYSGGYEYDSNDGGDSGMDASSGGGDGGYGSGDGMSGWTAQGGFINKRTMTMSKTPPNKKKRGGLASRR